MMEIDYDIEALLNPDNSLKKRSNTNSEYPQKYTPQNSPEDRKPVNHLKPCTDSHPTDQNTYSSYHDNRDSSDVEIKPNTPLKTCASIPSSNNLYSQVSQPNDIVQSANSPSSSLINFTDKPMSLCRKLCFSVGHILNDVTASMWFTYMLIFLHVIIKFDAKLAGFLMLLGQVVDGICTPLIGYESDRTKGFCKLGRRKSWYLVGTLSVAFAFPFLFNPAIDGHDHPSNVLFVYYAPFVTVFQFGWAATQISHLSLIPDLTRLPTERIELNSYRYACTVLANITVFGVAWLLLSLNHLSPDPATQAATFDTLQPSDSGRFRLLVFTVMGIGIIFVCIFFFGTKEKQYNSQLTINADESVMSTNNHGFPKLDMKWTCWLKESQFYKVALLYMCSRLYTNINQVYTPMYLLYALNMNKQSIAIIPLIIFSSGFVATILMKRVTLVLGPKVTFFIGLIIGGCGCVYVSVIQSGSSYVYVLAVVIGFGGSTMLVTALALTANLIDCNSDTGAFVYGAMSLTDKITNGIAIVIIQHVHPHLETMCKACASFYKSTLTYVPAGALILAFFALISLGTQEIGVRRAHRKILNERRKLASREESQNLLSEERSYS